MLLQKLAEQRNKPLLINRSCFEKALVLFQRQQFNEALQQIVDCLKQTPNDVDSKLMKVQILSAMKQFDQAIQLITAWIDKEPTNELWFQTLHLLGHASTTNKNIIATLTTIAQKHPNNLFAALYLSDCYIRMHQNDDALNQLSNALKLTNNATLKTKILFQMALIQYEEKKFDQMKTTLEQALTLNVQFPPVFNLISYYYATKGKNLNKAQEFVTKALQANQNNPHFLDTQAVIYYKQKKYNKALTLLQQLAKQVTDDATIRINLAKVNYKLNNTEKAFIFLNQAQNKVKYDHEKRSIEKYTKKWKQ